MALVASVMGEECFEKSVLRTPKTNVDDELTNEGKVFRASRA